MGGYGSGGGRSARRVNELRRLDLSSFEGDWFDHGQAGKMIWSCGGVETGSIRYQLGSDYLELSYSLSGEPQPVIVRERFRVTFTDQPFGGRRRWLVCRGCGSRCRVLLGGKYFRCRQCYDATYASQYDPFRIRGLAKADAARERVGAEPGFANLWPSKPKGMHWSTYRRLQKLNTEANLAMDDLVARYL